jgi:hypothetical protein
MEPFNVVWQRTSRSFQLWYIGCPFNVCCTCRMPLSLEMPSSSNSHSYLLLRLPVVKWVEVYTSYVLKCCYFVAVWWYVCGKCESLMMLDQTWRTHYHLFIFGGCILLCSLLRLYCGGRQSQQSFISSISLKSLHVSARAGHPQETSFYLLASRKMIVFTRRWPTQASFYLLASRKMIVFTWRWPTQASF